MSAPRTCILKVARAAMSGLPFAPDGKKGPPDIDFIVQKTTEGTGEKVLREFNQSTLDDVGPLSTLSGITSIFM